MPDPDLFEQKLDELIALAQDRDLDRNAGSAQNRWVHDDASGQPFLTTVSVS